ncbi:epoxide hydrolase family protein [Xylanimonas sp. McL0601]|uniref:epoxide hydrolase family protein n=1 Tax=Xylanimonas sp. McL0601 TaxID=3414739 RepID=UPI003CE86B43
MPAPGLPVPDAVLDDLRERVRRTRWPEREPASAGLTGRASSWAEGVPLDWLRELADYWADEYDWRRTEARLLALPQRWVDVGGLVVHVVHVRSPHPGALPLVLTNGWPGSPLEYLDAIGPLTDPPAHGGAAADAFDVVVPSLPGYGLSGKPAEPGWGVERVAEAWAHVARELGYPRYGLHGTDWGVTVATTLAQRRPVDVVGLHLAPPLVAPDPATLAAPTAAERAALADLAEASADGDGYTAIQATRPQTLGYGLLDSPVGLAAWLLEKVVLWSHPRGLPQTALSRDQLLDAVTWYWVTGKGASAARLYRESIREVQAVFAEAAGSRAPDAPGGVPGGVVTVPAGASVFPSEVPRPSRRWAGRRFTDLRWWGEPARGGHFPAWEEPELFVAEVRGFFRTVRPWS